MKKHIEDIALDRSRAYERRRKKNEIRFFFQRLFPRLADRKIQREINRVTRKLASTQPTEL